MCLCSHTSLTFTSDSGEHPGDAYLLDAFLLLCSHKEQRGNDPLWYVSVIFEHFCHLHDAYLLRTSFHTDRRADADQEEYREGCRCLLLTLQTTPVTAFAAFALHFGR